METEKRDGSYEVLSPWADADPVPLKGISARLTDLAGKRIGFFRNSKRAAHPTLALLEEKLKARFPSLEFSTFVFLPNDEVATSKDIARYEQWLKSVDAVILAYGD
jgi:hypothetical protein